MRWSFETRLRLMGVAVFVSLVMGLAVALIVCWNEGPGMAVLKAGATAFLASMTLAVAVIAVLHQ
ncbi:hypothetical protein OEIGOIKO_02009 [Streptomyces chrestomyceticus JCM 4735]|uniref:Uncharacterized protein n=1 Tax=Streptomyces chrestomyceticus JCM 4735 TaxID=1306181 RepID=A0A7U9PX59_9ACTN|nr:hypothetical protein OEIGOIKO_02009 [Streptomyces chrestomyceticus JCM 4735]